MGENVFSPSNKHQSAQSSFSLYLSFIFLYFLLSLFYPPHNFSSSFILVRIIYFYYLFFFTVVPLTSCLLSCRPFVINATFSTGLVSSVSWLRQLTSSNHWWGEKFAHCTTKDISKTNNWNNQWFKLQLSTAQARRQKELQDLLKMSR